MPSRSLLNYAMLLLLAILVIVAVVPRKDEPVEINRLSNLKPNDINQISIIPKPTANKTNANQTQIIKHNNSWIISQPNHYPLDVSKLEKLLKLVSARSHAQYSIAETNYAKYGLDNPNYRITINNIDFLFGSNEPLQQRRYILKISNPSDKQVHLITDRYSHMLSNMPIHLLDHSLLRDQAISQLQLPGVNINNRDGSWEMQPTLPGISQDDVQRLIDDWRYLQALHLSFVDTTIDPSSEKISISLEHKADLKTKASTDSQLEALHFYVSHNENEVMLTRYDIGLRYHLTRDAQNRLLKLSPSNHTP